MSSLLPTIILLATAVSPNVTYQLVTDEFHQHNTYVYDGAILVDAPDRAVYILDTEACETKERLVFHNIIDEVVFFNNRSPRKSFFSLQKDYDRCLLVIKKITHRNNMYYNRDYDYWYPNYNHIRVTPKRRIRMNARRRTRNIHRHNTIINHVPAPKVIKKAAAPPAKPKVIVIKAKHHKKHIKVKNKIKKYHKKHSKR